MEKINPMKLFKKILIANRGEIAVRIIQTAIKLKIRTVAVYSYADKEALFVRMADESYCLESNNLEESYLDIPKLIGIAQRNNCKAIHPGYGFLSENPLFAKACEENNIKFIGPSSSVIEMMGNKIKAREIAQQCSVPVNKGIYGTTEELKKAGNVLGFPVLVKAAAGGGGKGMQIAYTQNQLEDALEVSARESLSYFGDASVYVEKFFEQPRHIEVQILCDEQGNQVHLIERECSIQRRYQKIIEECPSPGLPLTVRGQITAAALKIARSINYTNAGTIEFLCDESYNFYFLEMNTRIQVEHPVTELVTNTDIVEHQIKIASGFPLELKQNELKINGHAIEARIYAENPEEDFMPSPGTVLLLKNPKNETIRLDSGLDKPTTIHSFYDPMIAKISAWASERNAAIQALSTGLSDFIILGINTNINYLKTILNNESYRENKISTNFCEKNKSDLLEAILIKKNQIDKSVPILSSLVYDLAQTSSENVWKSIGFWKLFMQVTYKHKDEKIKIKIVRLKNPEFLFMCDFKIYHCKLIELQPNYISLTINKKPFQAYISDYSKEKAYVSIEQQVFEISRQDILHQDVDYEHDYKNLDEEKIIKSPLPGKITKINVEKGQIVKKGDVLLILEAMKMENHIKAPVKGKVLEINTVSGEYIDTGKILIKLG